MFRPIVAAEKDKRLLGKKKYLQLYVCPFGFSTVIFPMPPLGEIAKSDTVAPWGTTAYCVQSVTPFIHRELAPVYDGLD
jgi:hypothetical protein